MRKYDRWGSDLKLIFNQILWFSFGKIYQNNVGEKKYNDRNHLKKIYGKKITE